MKKICFAASSGGHLEQILMLKPLMDKYESFMVTEHTAYRTDMEEEKMYHLLQVNMKEILFPAKMLFNSFCSLYIIFKERPDVVISTGALAVIPLCLLAKLFRRKLIFIE